MNRVDLRIAATRTQASADAIDVSQSFASLLHRPSHAKVRSTTHRRAMSTKPVTSGGRLTISIDQYGYSAMQANDCQARAGAPGVVTQACESFPNLTHIFADGGYAGDKLSDALKEVDGPSIEIVRRPPDVTGFVPPCVREVVRCSTFPLFLRWAG